METYEIDHLNAVRALAPECMVLLRSDGAFPLAEPGEIARIIELKRDLGFPEGPWWLQLPVPFIDLEPHLRDPALVNLHALLTALLEARRAENDWEHSG